MSLRMWIIIHPFLLPFCLLFDFLKSKKFKVLIHVYVKNTKISKANS